MSADNGFECELCEDWCPAEQACERERHCPRHADCCRSYDSDSIRESEENDYLRLKSDEVRHMNRRWRE